LTLILKSIWAQVDSCGYGSQNAFAFSIGEKGFVGTGINGSVFWEYSPGTTCVGRHLVYTNGSLSVNNTIANKNYNPVIIKYTLANPANVIIALYDCTGRMLCKVEDGFHLAGNYSKKVNAGLFHSGVYICKLNTPSNSLTGKLIVKR
ncbi:MAG TPA: T9SS type A sorting domain-containing protein, partial [Chitinispirillaceae bacterium]|nr:T9SS type A sorting domain-containing protein [Chitinispirillaceae bacterium]